MELSRTLSAGVPLVMNIMVTDASTISDGALLCGNQNSTTTQGATLSVALNTTAGDNPVGTNQVSSAQASAAVDNVNAVNAYRFNIDTDGLANQTIITGGDWLPLCVSPDALYYAEHGITVTSGTVSATDALVNGITAQTGTTFTVVSSSDTGHVGGWVMDNRTGATSSASTAAPTFNGQLRFVSGASATVTFDLLTAMNTSTDSNLTWAAPPQYNYSVISSGGNLLRSIAAGTAGSPKKVQGLVAVENYLQQDAAPMHPLRQWVDDGLNGLTGQVIFAELRNRKFYSESG